MQNGERSVSGTAGRRYPCSGEKRISRQCNAAWANTFDENFAAPGSVVQDPTLPPGNLIMVYEAENHCPGIAFSS